MACVAAASFFMSISPQVFCAMNRTTPVPWRRHFPVSRHTTVSLIRLSRHRVPRILEQNSNVLLGKGGAPYANNPFAPRSRARAFRAHAFEDHAMMIMSAAN